MGAESRDLGNFFRRFPKRSWSSSSHGQEAQICIWYVFIYLGVSSYPPERPEKDGLVDRKGWEDFLAWFTPLDVKTETEYENPGSVPKTNPVAGYDFDVIYSICSPQ